MNKTIQYYNDNAIEFASNTKDVTLSNIQNQFIELLPEAGRILDFGCGSGRDAKYFSENGFQVEAIDGAEELCKFAREYSGIPVRCMLFQELNEINKYDGIWACSSIIHLSKPELIHVFSNMINALKNNGVIYTSFKYGDFEGMRKGRYFIDFTEVSFLRFITDIEGICIEKQWVTSDARPGRGMEQWLNLIMRK